MASPRQIRRLQQATTPVVCPVDGKDDTIQKVSAIVASGNASGMSSGRSGDGYYSTIGVTLTSDLARLLAPPLKPQEPTGWLGWLFILFILILIAPFLFLSVFLIMGAFSALSTNGIAALVNSPQALASYFIFFVVFILFIWRRNAMSQKKAHYMAEYAAYEKGMKKWVRFYYCYRHDLVFDPPTGETCSPQSMREFFGLIQPK